MMLAKLDEAELKIEELSGRNDQSYKVKTNQQ